MRVYDIRLDCGCLISEGENEGLLPCYYGYGCGINGCNENKECDVCKEQFERHTKAWKEYNSKKPSPSLEVKKS